MNDKEIDDIWKSLHSDSEDILKFTDSDEDPSFISRSNTGHDKYPSDFENVYPNGTPLLSTA